MKVQLTFIEPLLGTLAANKELATEFIAGKCKEGVKSDEIATIAEIDDAVEQSSTVFPKDEKGLFLWDYQVKGFFKDAVLAMITSCRFTQEQCKKIGLTKYCYKRTIDQHLFINPRKVYLTMPEGQQTTFIERPLRAETMRGERIALARSEACPAGTTCQLEIESLNDAIWPMIEECLEYGKLRGIGQWRNSGMGRFVYQKQ